MGATAKILTLKYRVLRNSALNKKEIVFAVLPIASTEKLIARFSPMADYLSKKIDRPIRLVTAPNFKSFKQRTESGTYYDLVFMAPVAQATLMVKSHFKKARVNTEQDLSSVHTPLYTASLMSAYKGLPMLVA